MVRNLDLRRLLVSSAFVIVAASFSACGGTTSPAGDVLSDLTDIHEGDVTGDGPVDSQIPGDTNVPVDTNVPPDNNVSNDTNVLVDGMDAVDDDATTGPDTIADTTDAGDTTEPVPPVEPPVGQVVFFEDFESFGPGAIGEPWTTSLTGGTATISTISKSAAANVLKIFDGSAAGEWGRVYQFIDNYEQLLNHADLELSFDVMLPAATPLRAAVNLTNNASGNKSLMVIFGDQELWVFYQDSMARCSTTVPLGQWLSVRMIYTYGDQNVTVYLNDVLTSCNKTTLATPENVLTANQISLEVADLVGGSPVGGSYYFDNLKVTRAKPLTWRDPVTGLIWQYSARVTAIENIDAIDYCEGLNLDGLNDVWRVPTVEELRSLVYGCAATATDGSCGILNSCTAVGACWSDDCNGCEYEVGPGNGCYWPLYKESCDTAFWSSTPSGDGYWGMDYRDTSLSTLPVESLLFVRCVHDPIIG